MAVSEKISSGTRPEAATYGRPPGPPRIAAVDPMFGALYGAGYLAGGDRVGRAVLQRYGPIVSVPLLGFGEVVLVADPVLVKAVFTAKPDVLLGGEGVGPAEAIYGSGSMFVQEEPEHLRRRRLLTPSLHGAALDTYAPIIEAATFTGLQKWPTDRPFRLLEAGREMMLDVIVRVIFGIDDPVEVARIGHPFEQLLELGLTEETTVRYALRRVGTLRWWPDRDRINRNLDSVVMPLIAQRRADPALAGRTDILSLLIGVRSDDGEQLSDNEIRDDLITLMLAGHETTATTLAWMFDFMLHDRGVLERVRREAFSGDTEYTHAVINETLRLRPPVPFTSRVVAVPFELGGYTLAPGTRIVIYIDAVNKSPETYTQAEEFVPERFFGSRPNTYAWTPFGGGIKRCIGASFAMLELTTVVHTLLRNAQFTAVEGRLERPVRRSVVVVPRNGTAVRCRRKAAAVETGL